MFDRIKIAPKLILFVLLGCTVILIGISAINYTVGKELMYEEMVAKSINMVTSLANNIDVVQNAISKIVLYASSTYEEACTEEKIQTMIYNIMLHDKEIQGSCFAYAPEIKNKTIYGFRDKNSNKIIFAPENLDYVTADWFTLPRDLEKPVWCDPYYDEGGSNILMVTYSVPIFSSDKRFLGVLTADVSLSWLDDVLKKLNTNSSGYNFLISNQGTFMVHPKKDIVMNESIFSLAEGTNNPVLREYGKEMIAGISGFRPYSKSVVTSEKSHLAYSPVKSVGWSVGTVIANKELFTGIVILNKLVILVAIVGFFLLLILSIFIAKSITSPITQLEVAAKEFANGNLEYEGLPIPKGENEISSLITEFSKMRYDILDNINTIQVATIAKERMERDLHIASSIQQDLISKHFEEFTKNKPFDLHAELKPAKLIGGDLYEFFWLSDEEVALIIGDVSGKGVPAALFMSVVVTVIRVLWQKGMSPKEAMNLINKELFKNNNTNMFVTLLLGIVNIKNKTFSYSIGGHMAPFIINKDKTVKELVQLKGTLLGVFEHNKYEENTIPIKDGETIFMYTDGVNECMNTKEEILGHDGLLNVLSQIDFNCNLKESVFNLIKKLYNFAEGAEQSDDITVLCFKLKE